MNEMAMLGTGLAKQESACIRVGVFTAHKLINKFTIIQREMEKRDEIKRTKYKGRQINIDAQPVDIKA